MSGAKVADRGAAPRRFKPYPAYKDSGVEWLGEIPAHWEVRKWRYYCHVTEGQVAPDDDRYRDRIMIAPNHIESGTGRILFTETADAQGAMSGKYLVKPGDLIYSKVRPALNKACIATGDWLCSADMYPVKITANDLCSQYLLYFVLSEPFVHLMVDESMRVAMPKVNREKLAACSLLIPPASDQDAIAAFLDREAARIDALVVKNERLIELLQEGRTALITRTVTRGLDPNVPMKDSGVEWLGEIPAHWEVKKLTWLTECLDGRRIPLNAEERGRMQGEYPYWGANSIVDYVDKWLFDEDLVLLGEDGASFFERTKPVAFHVHGKIWVNNHAHVLRPRRDIAPAFLTHVLNCVGYRAFIDGTTRDKLTQGDMNSIPIQCPPVGEQQAIALFLDGETAKIDSLVAKVRDAIDCLREFRTTLISAAVTGKIDVREEAA